MPSLPAFAADESPRSCGCAPRTSPTRAGSPKTRGTSPRPSGCTGRALRCSRPIIPIPRCCSARAAASPDSTRGPDRKRRPRPCSARSSKARPMSGSASRRWRACFNPMSKSCSRRAMTRTPSPTCSTRPRRSSGPALPRPRRSSRASSAAEATRRRGCSASRSIWIARSNGSGSSWRGSKRPPRRPTARG